MTRAQAAIGAGLGVVVVAGWLVLASGHVREDLPPEFAGKRNPLGGDAVVAAGAHVFVENCATCHGEHADGRGPASKGLVPPPANFSGGTVLQQHSDAYLFYRVSTGKPGTAMPSFHGVLDENQRWQVIAYLRSLAAASHP